MLDDSDRDVLLTPLERWCVDQAGELWNNLCQVVGDGPTRGPDLDELRFHIHALQKAVMGQAAARIYPEQFRLLGETIST